MTVVGNLITADYSTTYGPLAPGASATLRFRVTLDASLAMGTVVTNTGVVTWNTRRSRRARASRSRSAACRASASSRVRSGTTPTSTASRTWAKALAGWFVDLYRNGVPVLSAVTDATGTYRMMASRRTP